MKTRNIIIEIICLILVITIFFEGINKLARVHGYTIWLRHAPLLNVAALSLAYVIPIGEILLALFLLFGRTRLMALNATIGISILFILYVIGANLFSPILFWPYVSFWPKHAWMQKLVIALGWCWLAFTAIVLSKGGISFEKFTDSPMEEKTVNVG